MATQQISNPQGFGGITDLQAKGNIVAGADMRAEGTITTKTPVSITSTGGIIATATDGVAVIGVALEAAVSGDNTSVVCIGGPISMLAGGATTLGTPVIRSATTAGYVTSSATPVTGTVVGFALGASSAGRSWVWVMPGTNTSS